MRAQANYDIKIEGRLDPAWSDWFSEMLISYDEDDNTILSGQIDQATLHGFLKKIRDLGLVILVVKRQIM